MRQQLIIIGARAMGREVFNYAIEAGLSVKGFLDSNMGVLNGFDGYPPILGSVEEYEVEATDVFVCALGEPEYKKKYCDIISAKGGKFFTIVHPTAYVGRNVKIGSGSIISPNVTITCDTVIGEHVIVNVGATINHDNRIGDFVTICPGCHLAGRVQIGDGVFMGIGTSVIPDVCIGNDVFVAAGAVVAKSFESGKIKGVPAKKYE